MCVSREPFGPPTLVTGGDRNGMPKFLQVKPSSVAIILMPAMQVKSTPHSQQGGKPTDLLDTLLRKHRGTRHWGPILILSPRVQRPVRWFKHKRFPTAPTTVMLWQTTAGVTLVQHRNRLLHTSCPQFPHINCIERIITNGFVQEDRISLLLIHSIKFGPWQRQVRPTTRQAPHKVIRFGLRHSKVYKKGSVIRKPKIGASLNPLNPR